MISCRADLFNKIRTYRLIYALGDNRDLLKTYNPSTDIIKAPSSQAETTVADMWKNKAVLIKKNGIYILLDLSNTARYLDAPVYKNNQYIGKSYSFSEKSGNMTVNPDNGVLITIDPLEYTISAMHSSVIITKAPIK